VGTGHVVDPLVDYLCRQRDALVGAVPQVRSGDVEALHDMRVGVRRRATLRSFRSVLDQSRSEPLRAELSWFGDVLGGVRDNDVLADRLAQAVDAEPAELVVGPVTVLIRRRLAAESARARDDLDAALHSDRFAAIVAAIEEVAARVEAVPPKVLRARAGRALRRADRRLDAARTSGDDAALHAARRAYKRARYAVEVLEPLHRGPSKRLSKRLADLQDLLGAHQDAVVAEQALRELGMSAHLDGENAFTYGLLHARQRAAAQASLRDLDRMVRRVRSSRARGWLE
jgi:CHAD domain-containing protein